MQRVLFLASVALISFRGSANTISEYLGNTGVFLNEYHYGQMVTTPSGGPWHNIAFGFATPQGVTVYPGFLYLLSQEYLGLPSLLPSAPGLIAVSTGTAGFNWIFDSSVVLQPNTPYYFYEDGIWFSHTALPSDPTGPFSGYLTRGFPNLDTNFRQTTSFNYQLTGDPIPEPATLALLAPVLLIFLMVSRGRLRKC